MKITVHNYEAFLLDHIEGRLTDDEAAELSSFLAAHPELGADLVHDPLPVLPVSDATLDHLALYKDEPTADEIQVLHWLEGLMEEGEKRAFEARMDKDSKLRELAGAYRLVNLKPDAEQMRKDQLFMDLPTDDEERVLRYLEGLMDKGDEGVFREEMQRDPVIVQLLDKYRVTIVQPDSAIVFENRDSLLRDAKIIRLAPVFARAAAAAVIGVAAFFLWPVKKEKASLAENRPTVVDTLTGKKEVKEPLIQNVPAGSDQPTSSLKRGGRIVRKAPISGQPSLNVGSSLSQEPVVAKHDILSDTIQGKSLPVVFSGADTSQVVIKRLEDIVLLEDEEVDSSDKKSFWARVVNVAEQVRKLGVRGIEAEHDEDVYRLSVRSVSVEKKF